MPNTLAQQRSAFALEKVKNLRGDRKKFGTFSQGLPARIKQNGFGQTLAFLLNKGTDKQGQPDDAKEHTQAFRIIAEWLKQRNILTQTEPVALMAELSRMDQQEYLRAQEEALALWEWVKRYANAGLFS
ncbi:MAG: type III-B CRISPR module-associated protein Cmr5 [Syntrophobacterales bacterium]|nr:type III-B CRISPR module-associated protein Cmr5 [Syntrophobacterales bacterium]